MNIPYVMRKCTKCGEWKVANNINFCKSKKGKYGLASQCKECKNKYNKKHREENREYYKEYRKNHKEEHKEYNKKHRKEHRERYKRYNEKWRKENREKDKQCKKKWREENKEYNEKWRKEHREEIKEYNKNYNKEHNYSKTYYHNNKDKIKNKAKNYNKNNPEKKFNSHSKRRLKLENQGNGITKEQWYEMFMFFDFRCAYSGEYLGNENNKKIRSIDHIIPLDNNGEHEIWNLVPMLKSYNSSKGTKDLLEWYLEQPFFSIERLTKIYEWRIYAYEKWGK